VLLLDEPASALDPGTTSKIDELMVKLKKNYTVVLVAHNMQQAARVASKIVFLYGGDIVEIGPLRRCLKSRRASSPRSTSAGSSYSRGIPPP
jgi:phosphate transport system ATP-binding protein